MDAREATQRIMDSMVQERPASWPHGLGFHLFEKSAGDSVYLIKAGSTPVGFVGWQSRHEDGKRIGYYSVGLLPTYRGQGLAKEAVSQLIAIKSASVDEVRAIIQKDNSPSIHLADSLGVRVEKCATAMAARLLEGLGDSALARGAAGAGAGMGATYLTNRMTGADQWADPQAQRGQYAMTGALGAILAQRNVPQAVAKYVTEREVGGSGIFQRMLAKVKPNTVLTNPQVLKEFQPIRALRAMVIPTIAYGAPLAVEGTSKSIGQLTEGFNQSYAKTDGRDNMFEFAAKNVANKLGDRLEPTIRSVGDKAVASAMPVLQHTAEQAMPAVQEQLKSLGHEGLDRVMPMIKEYLQHAAVPAGVGMAGTAAGTGLGWMAGKGFYQDDKSKTPQERIALAKKQQTLKAILATLGGTVGGIGSMLPYYTGKATA